MSFTAKLYNCSDDPRKLNKTFSDETNVTGIAPTESCDILNPTFVLNYNSNYTTKNYIKVGAPFNRSYFITDMKIDIGKKIVISCAVDVLDTYKSSIKTLNTNVVRQENKIKEMLPDSNFVYLNENDVMNFLITLHQGLDFFGNQSATNKCFVLGIAGAENEHGDDIEGFTKLESEPADWSLRYMFYWLNVGTANAPEMKSIGAMISAGELPQGQPSFNDLVLGYGGVYSKN